MHGDPDRWEARRQKRRLMICEDEGESKYVTGQPHYADLPLSLHLKSRDTPAPSDLDSPPRSP